MTRLVAMFLRGDVALLLILVSLMLGAAALYLTPREEEPQIVVPMADVLVSAPGLSAREVEQQVTSKLEKFLYQIDGVEYVYSMSQPGRAIVTVRFYVGEDREDSLVKLYNKLNSNSDTIPASVSAWVVKPIEIDDVPIVNVTLWSREIGRYGDFELRRMAEQIQYELQAIHDTNRVTVIGGRPRQIRVELDPIRLASRGTSSLKVADALKVSNVNLPAGTFDQQNTEFLLDAGTFFNSEEDLRNVVVNVVGGRPVYLRDVADVIDGPAEVESYSWIGFGSAADVDFPKGLENKPVDTSDAQQDLSVYPAVHIAVAKQKGRNAVWVADGVQHRMSELADTLLPEGVNYRITRDYGETADEKVNELVEGLAVAVITVIGLIGFSLGWRAALVVAVAVPVCYSLTLFINLMVGYTINRVTMFALILALGLLVDDPITDVENIARYFGMKKYPPKEATLRAVQEVRPALILSTLAIIASFLPLAFITGMMGPYMAPMALNVPLTVTMSTVVAFVMTPWLAMVALGSEDESLAEGEGYDITKRPLYHVSRVLLGPILDRRWLSWGVLILIAVLLGAAMLLPMFRAVPLKMLPYDNKNEFQVVIDMPEGTTLDRTNAAALEIGNYLAGLSEVQDYEIYVGEGSPMDFNGMVRHYFLREEPYQADIRVNLVDKDIRVQQSHEIILRIRRDIQQLADAVGGNVKLVEVPPGPPVIATITAEVYGPDDASYDELGQVATVVEERLFREPGIVDVDSSLEAEQTKWVFVTDKAKAALSGLSTDDIARTLQLALDGLKTTIMHQPDEINPLWIELRVPRAQRSAIDDLREMYVQGQDGQMVQLGAVGQFVEETQDTTIYHKNLKRLVYVYGEVAGRSPADAILDMQFDRQAEPLPSDATPPEPRPTAERTWWAPGGGDPWYIPDAYHIQWAGEGEWKITLDVFRDLGLAFAAALMGIFVILMFQTGSRVLPVVIMLAIPLSLIGIMPGFWILNVIVNRPVGGFENPVFFTATAMIGMIGLAGIVVRNSVVLIDFIDMALNEGMSLREATIQSVAIRTRPILLTAGTTLLGNWVITLDPIFSGLAWAIIFGILTSTVFTLVVIPVVYWLLKQPTTSE
ncbi:MAG: efflux RND transporter permease subunit [Planctomycetaceae bacterium]|nr:efflux RND transporter permease subunit [Planctomycetaceae bacterium]